MPGSGARQEEDRHYGLARIQRTATRKVEFAPLTPGKVNMYVCGPTVYDDAHLGHAKTYVSFDLVVRYLRFSGYDVLYVQNLTDVGHLLDSGEDRILKKARQASATPMQIVETYARSYFQDMDSLGVHAPGHQPARQRSRARTDRDDPGAHREGSRLRVRWQCLF